MRFLSPRIHGILDYVTVGLFAAAPLLFMTEAVPEAVGACLAVAATLLLVSMFTRYPLGALRWIPFPVHGAIEFVTAPLLVAYPWIAGFSAAPIARTFFVVAGASLFVLWALTDYRAAGRDAGR